MVKIVYRNIYPGFSLFFLLFLSLTSCTTYNDDFRDKLMSTREIILLQSLDSNDVEIILSKDRFNRNFTIKTELKHFNNYITKILQLKSSLIGEHQLLDLQKLIDTVLYESKYSKVIDVDKISGSIKSSRGQGTIKSETLEWHIASMLNKGNCLVMYKSEVVKTAVLESWASYHAGHEAYFYDGDLFWNQPD